MQRHPRHLPGALVGALVLAGAACGSSPAAPPAPPSARPATSPAPAATSPAEALTGALRRAGVIYWSREAPCAPWRVERDASSDKWSLVHETIGDGLHTTVRYGYGARGTEASLTGPARRTEHHPPGTDGWSQSRGSYCLVRLPIGTVNAERAEVGDLRWYFDRATCERERGEQAARAAACLSPPADEDDAEDDAEEDDVSPPRPAR